MKFICECGKEFDNPQRFNGHKSHCVTHHLFKYGSLDKLKEATDKQARAHSLHSKEKRKEISLMWGLDGHKCERCGSIITQKFGSGRFCCRSCANNRKHSEETKKKISESNSRVIKDLWDKHPEKWTNNRHIDKKYCSVCGKELKYENVTGFCIDCLHNTEDGKNTMKISGKNGYIKKKENGRHIPWKSRNITSYAEKFWIGVLDNNNIEYKREVPVKHDNSNYFLDFYIEVNNKKIDLEIDGNQHRYRKESDAIRDNYLSSLHYIVYRIPWNEINSDRGKKNMKEKIDQFLDFYNSL